MDEFLVSLGESAEDVKVEIKSKKDLTKIRIKEQTGKSKEEIEEDVEKLERGKGLLGEKIKVRAETDGGKSLVKVELSFDTSAADKEALLAEIVERFSLDADTAASLLKVEDKDEKNAENGDGEETETKEAAEEAETVEEEERLQVKVKTEDGSSEVTIKLRFSLNSTDTAEIANAIAEKTQLTAEQVESVWKVKEKKPGEKKELEIEVEIEDGEAKVKVETGGSKAKFMLEETDREKIVQEIAAKIGISVDEVLKFVTFEEETEEPETEEDEDGEDDSEDETKEADGVKKEKGNGDEDEDDEDSEEGNGSNVSDNE